MTTTKKEPLIIDMRSASAHELFVLAKLLLSLNSLLACHGLKVQIKKTRQPAYATSCR